MKRIHTFHPPKPCRHEIVPATLTHSGLGRGPTLCHRIDLNTGHLFIGPDIFNLTRVAPENIIWPGPPPKIASTKQAKPTKQTKTKLTPEEKHQLKLAEMRAFIQEHL